MIRTIRIAIIVALLSLSASCAVRSTAPPLSADVAIETATIVASRDGAYYFMIFTLGPEIPDNTHATIVYQRLANPLQAQELDLGSMADSRKITFKSRPDMTVHGDHLYRLTLRLYRTSAGSDLIAERTVEISANISATIAKLMDIRLL